MKCNRKGPKTGNRLSVPHFSVIIRQFLVVTLPVKVYKPFPKNLVFTRVPWKASVWIPHFGVQILFAKVYSFPFWCHNPILFISRAHEVYKIRIFSIANMANDCCIFPFSGLVRIYPSQNTLPIYLFATAKTSFFLLLQKMILM